jgi:hypothetical protein
MASRKIVDTTRSDRYSLLGHKTISRRIYRDICTQKTDTLSLYNSDRHLCYNHQKTTETMEYLFIKMIFKSISNLKTSMSSSNSSLLN